MGYHGDFNSIESAKRDYRGMVKAEGDVILAERTKREQSVSVLWAIVRRKNHKDPVIECVVIRGHRTPRGRVFMVKVMREIEGPSYYSCPLEFLGLVPPPTALWAKGWRDKVRAYHRETVEARERLHDLRPGDVIVLPDSWKPSRLKVTRRFSRRSFLAEAGGVNYKVTERILGAATEIRRA